MSKPQASILFIEDDLSSIEAVNDFLQLAGFQVDCAHSGVEGLKLILNKSYDVILCDVLMPHSPIDLLYTAVQRVRPVLCKRFVFVSGYKGEGKADNFVRRVNGTLLWKPFTVGDLLSSIDLVLTAGAQDDSLGSAAKNV
jgi:CheY-like chemotaxis protein